MGDNTQWCCGESVAVHSAFMKGPVQPGRLVGLLPWLTGLPASLIRPGQLCQTSGQGQAWCTARSMTGAARERLAQPAHRWLELLRAEAQGSPPSFARSFL